MSRRSSLSRLLAVAATGCALLLVSPAYGATASAVPSPVPSPAEPAALPTALEGLAAYVPADSCDPSAKPGVVELGQLLKTTYPTTSYSISRTCGTDPLPTSEHYDGRAMDWFTSVRTADGRARAKAVIDWLFAKDAAGNRYANARRLGVMYVIWNNRIWGAYRAADGWRPYSSCAAHPARSWDTTCHRDHMHFSFSWEGAMGRTSFWTGQVAARDYGPCRPADLNWAGHYTAANPTACPTYPRVSAPKRASVLSRSLFTWSGMWLHRGSTGPAVSAVQQALGAPTTGSYDATTRAAVIAFQTAQALSPTGGMNAATWRALLHPTAQPDRTTEKARHPVLRRGDHGPAVVALQHRLHIRATGHFRLGTKHRVQRFQRHHHLRATGVVGPRTWRALGA